MWAGDQLALDLFVVSRRILKPAFEVVAFVADQGVTDHSAPLTTCRWVGSAIGSTISKRRPCWSEGMRARAIENGCFVFAAAQGGKHENGRGSAHANAPRRSAG